MSDPTPNVSSSAPRELATLGGGCFWCTEAIFSDLVGVESVLPGYSGGKAPNPSYEAVCGGNTGHAEVVQLTFDPQAISFKDILRVFFTVHDPTTKNRQGADVGTQYRSVILFHDPVQKAQAEEVIHEIDGAKIWKKPIVTELAPFTVFYPAEEYHRNYFLRNPESSYCQLVVAPKVAKFRKQFVDRLRSRQDPAHPPIRASQ
jgi:peptide-methionine (S)-S-oxide reductase